MACPPAVPEGFLIPNDLPVGRLSAQVQGFGRRLKGRGLAVTAGGLQDALKSLAYIDLTRKEDFKTALGANLVSRQEDLLPFDEEFERFWVLLERGEAIALTGQKIGLAEETGESRSPEDKQGDAKVSGFLYSRDERLALRDFKDWEVSDWREAYSWLSQWIRPFLPRFSRRYEAGRGSILEIRKMLRRSLRFGGDLLDLTYRKRRFKPRRLIFLADVSGSMEPYGRFFFLFIQAWMQTALPVEIFAFSTRLTRLTPWLRGRLREEMLETVQKRVPQWSSGTRIGESLELFLKEFGNKLPGSRSLLVIFSDGWDLGDPNRLREVLARLKRRYPKLFWLNPLMGCPDYQPLCQGMATALPFIDRLLPSHNLLSLGAAGRYLQGEV